MRRTITETRSTWKKRKEKKTTANKQINKKNGSIQFEFFFSTLHFIIIIIVLNVGFFFIFGVIVRSLNYLTIEKYINFNNEKYST